ncbi:hypothetical protein IGI04_021458 [Brassica rapa subsp. trilocularis]|uniref:indole-3-pyruvate monooxygenase n=1 Tax=Brassica rapa subsp. trilocularis TaxID=1813537 RepID=A0ABQ7M0W7_BRACM|nr:hypothetical protein IGI04_021458 [Brassica rapa subsp. trilocularis]
MEIPPSSEFSYQKGFSPPNSLPRELQSLVRELSKRFETKDSITSKVYRLECTISLVKVPSLSPSEDTDLYFLQLQPTETPTSTTNSGGCTDRLNGECYIPAVKRLDIFNGEIVHSSNYKSGHDLKGKTVLVARGGNSSMEMCFALNNLDARMAYFPVTMIDTMVMLMAKAMLFMYGDPFKYGAADQHKAFSPPNSLPDK